VKVAVLDKPYHFRIEERVLPDLKSGWALVKVLAAGICGSDVHFYKGEFPLDNEPVRGHEIAGIIADPGNTGFEKGQPVVINPLLACGSCPSCARGERHLCNSLKAIGGECQGGFAEYVAAPAQNLLTFDARKAPYCNAAMADCVAVAVHALNIIRLDSGESVLVMGDGTIGLLLVQMALAVRAEPVILLGKHEKNLNIAHGFGASCTYNIINNDYDSQIKRLSGRADVAFEVIGGASPPFAVGISSLKKGGRLAVLGLTGETRLDIPWFDLVLGEKQIVGILGYSGTGKDDEMRKAIGLIENVAVQLEPIITHRFAIDEIKNGFDAMLNKSRTGCIKAMILFDE